jgi:hypothetical protein
LQKAEQADLLITEQVEMVQLLEQWEILFTLAVMAETEVNHGQAELVVEKADAPIKLAVMERMLKMVAELVELVETVEMAELVEKVVLEILELFQVVAAAEQELIIQQITLVALVQQGK